MLRLLIGACSKCCVDSDVDALFDIAFDVVIVVVVDILLLFVVVLLLTAVTSADSRVKSSSSGSIFAALDNNNNGKFSHGPPNSLRSLASEAREDLREDARLPRCTCKNADKRPCQPPGDDVCVVSSSHSISSLSFSFLRLKQTKIFSQFNLNILQEIVS